MARLTPSIATIKKLFALSGNRCAYHYDGENCDALIIDNDHDIIGAICHIEAANSGWTRYNPSSNDNVRKSFANLILLCPNHHRKIDTNPAFTTALLKKMKSRHEAKFVGRNVLTDDLLNKILSRLEIEQSVEQHIRKSSKLSEDIIERLLFELDTRTSSLADKEAMFNELEEKYISLKRNIDHSDHQDNILKDLINHGRIDEAETLLRSEMDVMETSVKERNKIIAKKAYQLGLLLEIKFNYTAATREFEKAVEFDADKLAYQCDLAYNYITTGQYEKGLRIFNTLEQAGPSESFTEIPYANLVLNLGWACERFGEYERSIEHFKKALSVFEPLVNEYYNEVIIILNNLGMSYKRMGDYDQAIEYYSKAMGIVKLYAKSPRLDVRATLYTNIAGIYLLRGDVTTSFQYCQIALQWYMSMGQLAHPDVCSTYVQLAYVYTRLGQFPEAIKYLNDTLQICLKYFGEKHDRVARSYHDLACIHHKLQQQDLAVQYGSKAAFCYASVLGEEHPYTQSALKDLAAFRIGITMIS